MLALPPLANGTVPAAPGTIGSPGSPPLAAPAIRVVASTASSAKLQVEGAKRPFWLVLGESLNSGWEATGPGGQSLGPSQLIDGYANGWYVTPPPGGAFTITLQFAPQKFVLPAIVVSGGTLVLCLILGFVPVGAIRRRTRGGGAHAGKDRAQPQVAMPLAPLGGRGQGSSGEVVPMLGSPLTTGGSPPHLVACVLLAAAGGAVALAVMPPHWAVPVAGATAGAALFALRWSATRSLLSLAAVGCFAATGITVVLDQVRSHYPPGSSWPGNFESAGVLALAGVVALSADAVVELARRQRRPSPGGGGGPDVERPGRRRARGLGPPPPAPGLGGKGGQVPPRRRFPGERGGTPRSRQPEAPAQHRVAENSARAPLRIPGSGRPACP